MAAVVIVADHIAVAARFPFNPRIRLEGIGEARTMNHPLVVEIINQGVTGDIAHNGKIIITLTKRPIRRAARNQLFVVTAEQMHRQRKLPLPVLAICAARPLLGPRQRRQQKCRENPDDPNHHQELDQREADPSGGPPGPSKALAEPELSANPYHILGNALVWLAWQVCVWTHTAKGNPSRSVERVLDPPLNWRERRGSNLVDKICASL